MEKQKTLGILVIWMDTINQDLKKQKTRVCLVFETFQCRNQTKNGEKPKNTLIFFFEILIDRIHSNNPKKPSFFLLFHLRKKEKHIGNATKNIFWVKTKHFTIFCLAWVFFCFSRFCLLFSMWPKLLELQVPSSGPAQRVSKYCFFLCKYGCRHYWLHERVKQMIRLKQTRGWSGHKNFESAIAIEPECIRYYNYNPNVLNHSCAETCPPDDVTNDDIAMLRKGSGCVCVCDHGSPTSPDPPRRHISMVFPVQNALKKMFVCDLLDSTYDHVSWW